MIETRALGHMTSSVEIHLQEKKNRSKKFNVIDVYFCEKKIANHYLWKKWREVLKIKINDKLSNIFFEPIFRYIIKKRDKNFLVPFRHNLDTWNYHLSLDVKNTQKKDINYNWQHYDTKNIIERTSPIIKFTSLEIDFAYKILEKKKIFKKDKIILIIFRYSAYYDHIFSKTTLNEFSFRDNDIDDFKDLVKYLCEKNYKVIRMGKIMRKKINYKHDNFIDYAFSDFKSDFFDIFLFSISNFTISTGSGLDELSTLFRKKILHLNYGDVTAFNHPLNSNISFIYPKKFFDMKRNKELSIFDIFSYNLHKVFNVNYYINNKIVCKSLSAKQMISATKEMEDYIDNKYLDSSLEANREMNNLLNEKYKFENNFFWSRDYLDQLINNSD